MESIPTSAAARKKLAHDSKTPDLSTSNRLRESDIDHLAKSWLSPELIVQAQIRRVSSMEAAEILNRKDTGTLSGLVFPYLQALT